MKKHALIIIFILGAAAVFAESGSITLTNIESSTFYFILNPELESKSSNGDSFTSLDMTKFTSIVSGSTTVILNLTAGSHNIIGFWGMPGTKEYSVWSLSFSIEDDQTKTFPLRNKNYSSVSSVNTFKYSEIKIDNSYNDWNDYPAIAAFSKYYAPKQFILQTKDLVKESLIADSKFWGRGGTSIEKIKGFFGNKSVFLYFETSSRISNGLSIILYLFENRDLHEKNIYTIEIVADDVTGTGDVLLWERDKKEYVIAGTVKSSSFTAEIEVDISKLPESIQKKLFDNYSFDLVTNYFDKSLDINEEFYYTTLYFRDMISMQDVGK